jgi:putative DNA primase/helicase
MPDAISLANKDGFLLPFINGVLNTKTQEFIYHSPNHYSTHIIPVFYSKDDSIKNTRFADLLSAIVNNNQMRLKILRACLFVIFTNNLVYQIALYIYGPGGTGKSTFINLLIYLLGKEVTLSSSIHQINSKFGIASVVGKILLILNDVSLYRGLEPKSIKNIVTQDPMEAEIKYKQPFSFTPQCFTILTSNVLWDIKHSTTGLSRRMIYFPFDNVTNTKELNLFKISTNGEALGTLVSHLGGFVNWILSCPQEYLNELYQGGSKVTELISQDSIHVNPLHVFVKDCLIPNENSKVALGCKTSNYKALYGAYCYWCEVNNINAMSHKSYNILLLDLLKQQGWNISKKRTSIGFIIKGIEINKSFFFLKIY